MENKANKVKPSVFFLEEEHKKIKLFCVENNISIQEYIRFASLYCLEKKIKPKSN